MKSFGPRLRRIALVGLVAIAGSAAHDERNVFTDADR